VTALAPVNFHDGIWQEDDLAARITIRDAYRRERLRGVARSHARLVARQTAVTISFYRDNLKRVAK
jgi:hypothetical protein